MTTKKVNKLISLIFLIFTDNLRKPNTAHLIFSDIKELDGVLQVSPYMLSHFQTSTTRITNAEACSLFPPRTQVMELRRNIRVFETDFEKIKQMAAKGEDEADVVRRLIRSYEKVK